MEGMKAFLLVDRPQASKIRALSCTQWSLKLEEVGTCQKQSFNRNRRKIWKATDDMRYHSRSDTVPTVILSQLRNIWMKDRRQSKTVPVTSTTWQRSATRYRYS